MFSKSQDYQRLKKAEFSEQESAETEGLCYPNHLLKEYWFTKEGLLVMNSPWVLSFTDKIKFKDGDVKENSLKQPHHILCYLYPLQQITFF